MAMALPKPTSLLLLLLVIFLVAIDAQVEDSNPHDWSSSISSYSYPFGAETHDDAVDGLSTGIGDDEDEESGSHRRALFWHRMRYYISYGALSADRVPCPPRSGRSYYTHNCYRARGPVHPYTRGCSAICQCRR